MPRTQETPNAATSSERANPIRQSFRRFRRSLSAQRNKEKHGEAFEQITDDELAPPTGDEIVFRRPALPRPLDTRKATNTGHITPESTSAASAEVLDPFGAVHRSKSLTARARELFRARSSSRPGPAPDANSNGEVKLDSAAKSRKSVRVGKNAAKFSNGARSMSIVAFSNEMAVKDAAPDRHASMTKLPSTRQNGNDAELQSAKSVEQDDPLSIRRSSSFSRSISSLFASVRRRSRSRSGDRNAKAAKRHTVCASGSSAERFAGIYQSGSRSPSPPHASLTPALSRPIVRSASNAMVDSSRSTLQLHQHHPMSTSLWSDSTSYSPARSHTNSNSCSFLSGRNASTGLDCLNSSFARRPASSRAAACPIIEDLETNLAQLEMFVGERCKRLGPLVDVTNVDYTGYRTTQGENQVCIPSRSVRSWLRTARKVQQPVRLTRTATIRRSVSQTARRASAHLADTNRYSADTCPLVTPCTNRSIAFSRSPVGFSLASPSSDYCLSASASGPNRVAAAPEIAHENAKAVTQHSKETHVKSSVANDDCVYVNIRELRQAHLPNAHASLPPPASCTYQSFGNPGDTSALSVVRESDLSSVTVTQTSQLSGPTATDSPMASDSPTQSDSVGSPTHSTDACSTRLQCGQINVNRHSTVTVLSGSSCGTADSAVELASSASSDRESRARRTHTQNLEPLCEKRAEARPMVPVIVNIVQIDSDSDVTSHGAMANGDAVARCVTPAGLKAVEKYSDKQKVRVSRPAQVTNDEQGERASLDDALGHEAKCRPHKHVEDLASINSLDDDGFYTSMTAFSLRQSLVSLEATRVAGARPPTDEQSRQTHASSVWQQRNSVNLNAPTQVGTHAALLESSLSDATPTSTPTHTARDSVTNSRASVATLEPFSLAKRAQLADDGFDQPDGAYRPKSGAALLGSPRSGTQCSETQLGSGDQRKSASFKSLQFSALAQVHYVDMQSSTVSISVSQDALESAHLHSDAEAATANRLATGVPRSISLGGTRSILSNPLVSTCDGTRPCLDAQTASCCLCPTTCLTVTHCCHVSSCCQNAPSANCAHLPAGNSALLPQYARRSALLDDSHSEAHHCHHSPSLSNQSTPLAADAQALAGDALRPHKNRSRTPPAPPQRTVTALSPAVSTNLNLESAARSSEPNTAGVVARNCSSSDDTDTSLSKLDTSAQLGKLVSRLSAVQIREPGSPVYSNYRKLYSLSNPFGSPGPTIIESELNTDAIATTCTQPLADATKSVLPAAPNSDVQVHANMAESESSDFEEDSLDEDAARELSSFSKRQRSYRFAMRHAK